MKFLLTALLLVNPGMVQADAIKPSNPVPKSAIQRREDWKSLGLTAALSGAELYDGISTKVVMRDCPNASWHCEEIGPAARLVLGPRPTWPRMVMFGTLEAGGAHFLARRMRQSQNRWVHRFWWAPEVGLIAAHLYQGSGNFSRAAYYRSRAPN